MENEIRKLIHKYKQMKRTEPYEDCIALDAVIADFNELLEYKQNNCCSKPEDIANETMPKL